MDQFGKTLAVLIFATVAAVAAAKGLQVIYGAVNSLVPQGPIQGPECRKDTVPAAE